MRSSGSSTCSSSAGCPASGSSKRSAGSESNRSRSASMPKLIIDRSLADDRYTLLRDAKALSDLPDGTPLIVPLALWIDWRAALIARGDVGVLLSPADDPAKIADDV